MRNQQAGRCHPGRMGERAQEGERVQLPHRVLERLCARRSTCVLPRVRSVRACAPRRVGAQRAARGWVRGQVARGLSWRSLVSVLVACSLRALGSTNARAPLHEHRRRCGDHCWRSTATSCTISRSSASRRSAWNVSAARRSLTPPLCLSHPLPLSKPPPPQPQDFLPAHSPGVSA